MPHDNIFSRFASTVTRWTGSTWAFIAALAIIAAWGLTGPLFHYSDTWQLVINTGTTIVTFVMVFLIQRAQDKEWLAGKLKTQRDRRRDRGREHSADLGRGPIRKGSRGHSRALSQACGHGEERSVDFTVALDRRGRGAP